MGTVDEGLVQVTWVFVVEFNVASWPANVADVRQLVIRDVVQVSTDLAVKVRQVVAVMQQKLMVIRMRKTDPMAVGHCVKRLLHLLVVAANVGSVRISSLATTRWPAAEQPREALAELGIQPAIDERVIAGVTHGQPMTAKVNVLGVRRIIHRWSIDHHKQIVDVQRHPTQ